MLAAPIGMFDSGVGGLTVARETRQLLPNEDVLYYADTANCPYGERDTDEVIALSVAASERLLAAGAKLIVVACNTASGAALPELRRRFPVPFVGLVPAIKPACTMSRRGRVGVLATTATVQADLFADVVNRFANHTRLTIQTCPGLADIIESGAVATPEADALLRGYLAPLQAAEVDVVVLGCTHYPLLRDQIQRVMGADVQIVDSGQAVARQVRRVLIERELARDPAATGRFVLTGSGDLGVARRMAGMLGLTAPVGTTHG